MPGLESRLNAVWYGPGRPPWLLLCLSSIYGRVVRRRKPVNPAHLRAPVLVIGNFTAGGTGKTPLLIAVVEYLKRRGYRPGVVSRGYGRHSRSALSVRPDSTAQQAGDEPLLIRRRTGVPVRVDRDRLAAAKQLIDEGCDIVVSDDGLQHRNLPRTLEIEVFDAVRGYGNGCLLPAGPLREPPRPVDIRVGNGLDADSNGDFAMQLALADAVRLHDGVRRPLSDFAMRPVHALAGIGDPSRFFRALRAAGIDVIEHPFPDHHRFAASDLPAGEVLMTEKDAVKCDMNGRTDLWAVPVDARLSARFFETLGQALGTEGIADA